MTDEQDTDESPIFGSLAAGGQFYRRPGARLTEPQDESVISLSSGASAAQHESFHAFDKAHTVMLTEEGIIQRETGRAILNGLKEMEAQDHVALRQESGRSAHAGEAYLITELGEDIGGSIHLGRSSHDLASTSARLARRDQLLTCAEAALDLIEGYVERAAEHLDDPVPTYTGLQHAQVATIGYCLVSFARPLERDVDRMLEAYKRVNKSPAGAAVGTTSDFPINRDRVAELLGFDGVLDNGEDVDKSFDGVLESAGVFATVAANVAIAADRFLIWYASEFSLIDIPDRFAGTSSIMPHKKNPHAIESVQRDTNDMIGALLQTFAATKNIGGGVRLGTEPVEQTIDNLETWTSLVAHLQFDVERARELVYRDWALATDLAGMLVREADLPWRSAHQIIAILVRNAEEEGFGITEVTPKHIDSAAREYLGSELGVSQAAIDTIVDADRAIEARAEVPGSPAPERVREQIAATESFIEEHRRKISAHREDLCDAEETLEAAVDAILEA